MVLCMHAWSIQLWYAVPQTLECSTSPFYLKQPPLDVPPSVYPIRLVERHLGRPKDGAVDGFHAKHELNVDVEGVSVTLPCGKPETGTYRMILVSGFVLPASESAAHDERE